MVLFEEPLLWLFNRFGFIGANEPIYPVGETIPCPNCGSEYTLDLESDDNYILVPGFLGIKRKVPVNHFCLICGHRWNAVEGANAR